MIPITLEGGPYDGQRMDITEAQYRRGYVEFAQLPQVLILEKPDHCAEETVATTVAYEATYSAIVGQRWTYKNPA
jgi:hypothetical protein